MKNWLYYGLLAILIAAVCAACTGSGTEGSAATQVSAAETETALPTLAPTPSPQPTPIPERSLVVCLGNEPETLFFYGGNSASMWSVLEAVYDGPFDMVNYKAQPVIVEAMPSVENGAVLYQAVSVLEGDIIVDANGELTQLSQGTLVLPAGCKDASCAVSWNTGEPLEMEQMTVQFHLLPGLFWSDGAPLTANDSLYSFNVAGDAAMLVKNERIARTAAYTAADDLTVEWQGIPGYFPRDVQSLLWLPLPQHQLSAYAPAELLTLAAATETPLGWGAYAVEEWVRGDHITLRKNEHYYRAAENLPAFDTLVFRFPGSTPYAMMDSLSIGECDVIDRTAGTAEIVHDLRVAEIDGKLNLYLEQGPGLTQIMFGITPASYDDGYQPYENDRPNFFADARVRKAITACLDRNYLISNFYYDMTSIPDSYLTPDHPLYFDGGTAQGFDPEAGKTLLEDAGWVLLEGGVRVANGVEGVADGTEFRINLTMPMTVMNEQLATTFTENLAQCGIALTTSLPDTMSYYTPGPEGAVFGRQFDLAAITWMTGSEPPCSLFLSSQIPNAENYWLGVNAGGYNNAAFDAACMSARQSRLDTLDVYQAGHETAQQVFVEEQPAIPLYFQLTAAASRVDLCGYQLDASSRSDLWNVETWDVREDCIQQ